MTPPTPRPCWAVCPASATTPRTTCPGRPTSPVWSRWTSKRPRRWRRLAELSERTLAEHEIGELTDLPEIAEFPEDSPELAAARRRHPSHPDFIPVQTPVVTDHERTVNRLEELADTATELTDVRPGPLGTLDVYVFADGTTLCMTPVTVRPPSASPTPCRPAASRCSWAARASRAPMR